MAIDVRPTLAAPDDDPWLWLEEIEGARADAWVTGQNARTVAAFGGSATDNDAATLAAIFDRPDKIAIPGRRGPWLSRYERGRGGSDGWGKRQRGGRHDCGRRPIEFCARTLPRCGVEMKITRATLRRGLKINPSSTTALVSGESFVCAGSFPKK